MANMFEHLNTLQKEAIAKLALSIIGTQTNGRIRTNDPVVFGLFVDLFGVLSQEDILPLLKEIIQMSSSKAAMIASSLDNDTKCQFKYYMQDILGRDDARTLLSLAIVLRQMGLQTNSSDLPMI